MAELLRLESSFFTRQITFQTPAGNAANISFGGFSTEFDATFADVDIDSYWYNSSSNLEAYGLYGVYRSSGEAYFKGKAGMVYEKIGSMSDTGLSVGVGGGIRLETVSLEAEFTILEEDANYFSVGVNYHF